MPRLSSLVGVAGWNTGTLNSDLKAPFASHQRVHAVTAARAGPVPCSTTTRLGQSGPSRAVRGTGGWAGLASC